MEWKLTLAHERDDPENFWLVIFLEGNEFLRFDLTRAEVYELAITMLSVSRADAGNLLN